MKHLKAFLRSQGLRHRDPQHASRQMFLSPIVCPQRGTDGPILAEERRNQMSNELSEVLIDERLWQKWVQKNEAKDKLRFARRVRIAGILLLLLAVSAVVWRFTG